MHLVCCGCHSEVSDVDAKNILNDDLVIGSPDCVDTTGSIIGTKIIKLRDVVELLTGYKVSKDENCAILCMTCCQKIESFIIFRMQLLTSFKKLSKYNDSRNMSKSIPDPKSSECFKHKKDSTVMDQHTNVISNEVSDNYKLLESNVMVVNADHNNVPLMLNNSLNYESETNYISRSNKLLNDQKNKNLNDSDNLNKIQGINDSKEVFSKVQEKNIESEVDVHSGKNDEVLKLDTQHTKDNIDAANSSESETEVVLRPSHLNKLKDDNITEFKRIKAIYKNHHAENDFVITETPVHSKQKCLTTIIPGTPDSILSNSSVFGEDISTIAATQSCSRKSVSSHPSSDQLLQKVLQNNKSSARTLSLDSNSEDKRTETNDQNNKSQENKIWKDGDESIEQLTDKNKMNRVQIFPRISHFTVERAQNDSTSEQNDPNTSCESDDIFEAATQRINIDLDFKSRRESCSSDETCIDEDVISNDVAPTQKTCNVFESSTPIKKTNLEDQLEKLKSIQSDIAMATKCLQERKDLLEPVENNTKKSEKESASNIDDIDMLETQIVYFPNSTHTTKEGRTTEDQIHIDNIDVLDTQIMPLPDSNHDANNAKQNEKRQDTIDIALLDTQPISATDIIDINTSSSATKEVGQNKFNNGSVEDLDYEMAATQILENVEEVSTKQDSKIKDNGDKKRKINPNDSLEQKLNDMFEEINDDHVTELSMISTQSLQNVLESSQCSSRVMDAVESNKQKSQIDSQNSEKYFSSLISKRKHNVQADSQESKDSNITISARRKKAKTSNVKTLEKDKNGTTLIKTSPRRSIKEQEKTTQSESTVDHVEKDLLNSFEVSVHSFKKDVKRAETPKSLDEGDDDILTRLPEVNISGTLSNPATMSSTSIVRKGPTRRSSNKKANKKSDAPEDLETKSTTGSLSNLTEEDTDYENFKRIAEELISKKSNETQSTRRRRTNTREKISIGSNVSGQSNVTNLSNKPAANVRGRKSKRNITTESTSILTYVTRNSPKRDIESTSEINSNTVLANPGKRQTRKQQTNKKTTKENSSDIKDNKSDDECDSKVGKESQEVEMIMTNALTTTSMNTRKRKKMNASSDNESLKSTNTSHESQDSTQYKIPVLKIKRVKITKRNASQSSTDSISTEDSLTGDSESSTTTYSTKTRSTRSKRINMEEQKNENNIDALDKLNRENSTSMDAQNGKEDVSVPSTPTTRRSLSHLSNSLNSSFSGKEKILFTGITDDEHIKVLKVLGGTKVEDPSKCTILVTDKIRRTTKFLSALARAVPIVSINWLHESKRVGHFLDWENYMLKDPAMEAKYGFRLRKSLDKAREQKLLDGYTVLLSPNIESPPIVELKTMITSCGGKALLRAPLKLSEKTIILSHQDDLENARKLLSKAPKNVTIQSTEFLLTGILKQELDFVRHKLI
ncbi:hypothetical protein KPH14_009166 [Odynerus spinipes]|uniref:PAX-interacting protein 1 n=1 Tax=Odynerus spinipes TaxID=1348599 RepID=A0AAD9VR94_9HYME|nr:hypothetical protein KPH14_009166 [Odynerus spinipes]